MTTVTLQTIELLSLEHKQGRYWMELAVERKGVRTVTEQEIDADTYNNLMALEPFSAGKVRLSLRKGWDPYRQSHYSMLVKSGRLLNETRYFCCSSSYAAMLEAWGTEALAGGNLGAGGASAAAVAAAPGVSAACGGLDAAGAASDAGAARAAGAASDASAARTAGAASSTSAPRAAGAAEAGRAAPDSVAASHAGAARSAVGGVAMVAGAGVAPGAAAAAPAPGAAETPGAVGAAAAGTAAAGRPARRPGVLLAAGRLLLLAGLFFFAWFELESRLFGQDEPPLSEHETAIIAAHAGDHFLSAPIPRLPWEIMSFREAYEPESVHVGTAAHRVKAHAEAAANAAKADGSEAEAHIAYARTEAAGAGTPTGAETLPPEGVPSLPEAGADQAAESADGEADSPPYDMVELEVGVPYYSLPRGYVALTFDDGPSEYTKQIVDVLKEYGVAATFLFVGRQAARYPEGAEYAAEQGMAVGNHSWDHSDLTLQKPEEQAGNIRQANEQLESLTGHPPLLFRPPYGATDEALAAVVADAGMKPLMWNRDPQDWKAKTAKDIIRYFKKWDPSGGIYVLHEKKATLEALPEIIDYLKERELTFVIFR